MSTAALQDINESDDDGRDDQTEEVEGAGVLPVAGVGAAAASSAKANHHSRDGNVEPAGGEDAQLLYPVYKRSSTAIGKC